MARKQSESRKPSVKEEDNVVWNEEPGSVPDSSVYTDTKTVGLQTTCNTRNLSQSARLAASGSSLLAIPGNNAFVPFAFTVVLLGYIAFN